MLGERKTKGRGRMRAFFSIAEIERIYMSKTYAKWMEKNFPNGDDSSIVLIKEFIKTEPKKVIDILVDKKLRVWI